MSLDLWLEVGPDGGECYCHCGHKHTPQSTNTVFDINITHNLRPMAVEAGVAEVMWSPMENGYEYAWQIIPKLERGLSKLEGQPSRFTLLNPSNGWGTYDGFKDSVKATLEACRQHPHARLKVST